MLKVLGTLLMTCGVAQADQIIFSQYDGKVTWRNTYVEVDNAKDWFKPIKGVTFHEARNMKSKPAIAGSPAIAARAATAEVPWTTDKITRTYLVGNLNQAISEQIYYRSSSSATFYDKLTINTYNNNTNYSSYGVPAGTLSFSQAYDITNTSASGSDVVVNYVGKPMNTYHTTAGTAYAAATEAQAAVDAIAAEPKREEDICPARLIVRIPWDTDVKEFIKDYMGS
jgi:hypothetical protein